MNMPDGEETLKLLHACSEEMRRFVALKDKRRLGGLTANQLDIIHYVGIGGEGVMLADMIKHFGMSRSSATQIVARLIRCGYLKKLASQGDRRNVIILPTEKLRSINSSIDAIEKSHLVPIFESLSAGERAAFYGVLNKVHEKFLKGCHE